MHVTHKFDFYLNVLIAYRDVGISASRSKLAEECSEKSRSCDANADSTRYFILISKPAFLRLNKAYCDIQNHPGTAR